MEFGGKTAFFCSGLHHGLLYHWSYTKWKLVDELLIFLFQYAKSKNKFFHKIKTVKEYGDTVFSNDGNILYCKIWEVKVEQYVNREKHEHGLQATGERKIQQMLTGHCNTATSANSLIYEELSKAFVSANISFHKLSNNVL